MVSATIDISDGEFQEKIKEVVYEKDIISKSIVSKVVNSGAYLCKKSKKEVMFSHKLELFRWSVCFQIN